MIRDEARWHLGYLDALRGIAVLGVIAVHSSLGLTMHALAAIPFSGQRGVQLFYIVSAFTLFLSYEHRKDEAHPTRNFFIRRFFRIAPMFYVAIALACIFAPQVAGTRTDILLSLFFVHGFVPSALMHGAAAGWSVGDEWIFYLILPLLFRSITRFSQAAWAVLLSAPVAYIVTQALAHRASPNMAEFFTFLGFPVELPVFLMGIAAYFFWKEHIALRSKNVSLMLLGASAGLWVIDLPFNNRNLYATSFAGVLLLLSLSIHSWPFLVNRCTIFVGRISFSVYLLHVYAIEIFHSAAQRSPLVNHPDLECMLVFVATTAVTLPVAWLTWMFIEEPGRRLASRFIRKHSAVAGRDTREMLPSLESPSSPALEASDRGAL